MNYGGRSSDSRLLSERAESDEYSRAVAKISVAQICESVGFESFQGPVLESLSDVAIRYIRELGKITASYSNISNRTECNVFDLVRGLEDLGFSKGVSDSHDCEIGSGVIRDLIEYVDCAEEVPFAQSLPRYPVIRDRTRMVPSFTDLGESPSGNHIPAWLPAFPDPHTYICTPVWNQRTSDPREDKIEQARQRRKAERSLLSLQQRLMGNGSAGPSASVSEPGDGAKESQSNGGNPVLDSPLQSEEKNVTQFSLPEMNLDEGDVEKSHVSVLDAFAPVFEAVEGGVWELEDREQNSLQGKRPAVSFRFARGKKLVGGSSGIRLWNKKMGRQASWMGRDDERDDKKRRAELILRQSMENPQELNQF